MTRAIALALALLIAAPIAATRQPPPLPMLPSVAHARVEVAHDHLVTIEDVNLPRGGWRYGDLDLYVAFGAPGAPMAFNARLLPVGDGALEPSESDAGERLPVNHQAHRPPTAHEPPRPIADGGRRHPRARRLVSPCRRSRRNGRAPSSLAPRAPGRRCAHRPRGRPAPRCVAGDAAHAGERSGDVHGKVAAHLGGGGTPLRARRRLVASRRRDSTGAMAHPGGPDSGADRARPRRSQHDRQPLRPLLREQP